MGAVEGNLQKTQAQPRGRTLRGMGRDPPRPRPRGPAGPGAPGARAGRRRQRRRRRAGPGGSQTGRAGLRRLSSSAATAPGAGSPTTPSPPPQSINRARQSSKRKRHQPPDLKMLCLHSHSAVRPTDENAQLETATVLFSLKFTPFTAATTSVRQSGGKTPRKCATMVVNVRKMAAEGGGA